MPRSDRAPRISRKMLTSLAALVVVASVATVALAAIPTQKGVIHGCYAKTGGRLIVIDPAVTSTCPAGTKPVNWNQQGAPGMNTLIAQTPEAAGANCPNAGTKVTSGPDNGTGGGIASDGILEPGEVQVTSYVCNGANGEGSHLSVTVFESEALRETSVGLGDQGGSVTYDGDLYDSSALTGSPIGSTQGQCIETAVSPSSRLCTWTTRLAGGDIVVSGRFDDRFADTSQNTLAVVGGTGDYAGARGTVDATCDYNDHPSNCRYAFDLSV